MFSSSKKNTFMSFETFKNIIDNYSDDFELQLEGGEPLLHPDLYLFLEYARNSGRCKKVIITTNGILLYDHLDKLVNFHKYYQIPVLIKMSINYLLYKMDKDIFKKGRDLFLATEFIDGFYIKFNVRLRHSDDYIVDMLKENKIYEQSNVYYLQRYGKYENESDYDLPVIVQNIDDWFIFACDGKCFNKNLIERSNYERTLK
jgi:MoaA/NifB/PqqE/SkfB family radical SAM enzyme